MREPKSLFGLIVIWLVPDPVTWLLVTSIVSTTELSDFFLMMIYPVSTSTTSEKLIIISLPTATAVALWAGSVLDIVGGVVSTTKSLLLAKERSAPGEGRVNETSLLDESWIVAPFKERAEVEV